MVADALGIVLGEAIGGQPHGLDRPPGNLRPRIEGQQDEAAQYALPPDRHLGDLLELSLLEQLAEGLFQR